MRVRILAVDPDLEAPGLAVLEQEKLVKASLVKASLVKAAPCPLGCRRRCAHVLLAVADVLELADAVLEQLQPGRGDVLVLEGQFIPRSGKLDPQPLLALSFLTGALAAGAGRRGALVMRVAPSTWRGGKDPKSTVQTRILASLTPTERALIPTGQRTGRYLSEPTDAAGMALWACRRLGHFLADPGQFLHLVDKERSEGGAQRAVRTAAQGVLLLPPIAPANYPDGKAARSTTKGPR